MQTEHIAAQRGDDLVCAGAGNDRVGDEPDPDLDGDLFQGSGNDAFSGGPGDDSVGFEGSDGADRLFGDDGNDSLRTGSGPMVGWGGPGADQFAQPDGGGRLQLYGGPGNDSWSVPFEFQSNGSTRFFGGDGDDLVFLQSANNVVVYGNHGDDTLEFPAGDGAGPSNLVLDGGAGSDRLVSFFGLESVPGRPGSGRADRRGRLQRPRWVGARHASRR
jgi:Ca2+-binding RTX toxin-like protein